MINIEKKTVITVKTTDGKELKEERPYIYSNGKSAHIGIFKGITQRGALVFVMEYDKIKTEHKVMPKSIDYIYENFEDEREEL